MAFLVDLLSEASQKQKVALTIQNASFLFRMRGPESLPQYYLGSLITRLKNKKHLAVVMEVGGMT